MSVDVSKAVGYALLVPADLMAASKMAGYALLQPDKAAVSKAVAYATLFEGLRQSKMTGYALLWPQPRLNPFDGVVLEAALDKQRSITQQIGEAAGRMVTASRFDDLSGLLPLDRADSVPYLGSDDAVHSIPQAAFRGGISRTQSGLTFVLQGDFALPITAGQQGMLLVSDYFTITGWTLTADTHGDIAVDIWRANGAVPSVTGHITGTLPPALTSVRSGGTFGFAAYGERVYGEGHLLRVSTSSSLAGWDISLVPGDVLLFTVLSNAFCSRVTLSLQGYRT